MRKSVLPSQRLGSSLAFLLSLTIITASLAWPNRSQGHSPLPAVGPNPVETTANFIDDTVFFVRQHYVDFLTREPDPSGLQFWINEITSCGNNTQCSEVKRIHVSAAFFLSIEFQETGYLVYRFYKAAFGNIPAKPVPVTRGEFLPDTVQIGRGVRVGIGDWQVQLEQNKVDFAAEFVTRPRFTSQYPSSLSAAQFVDALNTNTGGVLNQNERNTLANALASGQMTRAQVLRAVAEDQTLRDSEFTKAFVLMQYFGYLMRNPDASPDTNFDGFNFWLTKLNQFNGDFIRAEMVKAFISSIEFRERFAMPEFSAFSNPADVLLVRAKTAKGEVIDYFGEKDASGQAIAVRSVRVENRDSQVTNITLDDQSRPKRIQAFNGVVFNITWLSNTNIVISALTADGSIQANVPVDLAFESAASATSTSRIRKTSRIGKAPRISRVKRGEPIRLAVTQLGKGQRLPPTQAASAGTSLVNVKRCGTAVDDADVGMTIIPSGDAGNAYTVPATFTGSGQYSVSIPTQPSPVQEIENVCEQISGVAGLACEAFSAIPPGTEAGICARIGAAVALRFQPAGAIVFSACEGGFAAARRYCAGPGYSGGVPGAPSLLETFCGNITELVDRFFGGELQLIPIVSIPGEGVIDVAGATAPSSGPFPTFDVTAPGEVQIVSFKTTPADPGPGQSYVAEALIQCAPPGTEVTISVEGTDLFFDSVTTTIQGDANVALTVPGGAEGVVDTVTITVRNGPTRTIVLVF